MALFPEGEPASVAAGLGSFFLRRHRCVRKRPPPSPGFWPTAGSTPCKPRTVSMVAEEGEGLIESSKDSNINPS